MKKLGCLWLTIMTFLTGCASNDAASVSVIGGADGPTSIFVAWQLGKLGILIASFGVLIAVVILIVCIVRRK